MWWEGECKKGPWCDCIIMLYSQWQFVKTKKKKCVVIPSLFFLSIFFLSFCDTFVFWKILDETISSYCKYEINLNITSGCDQLLISSRITYSRTSQLPLRRLMFLGSLWMTPDLSTIICMFKLLDKCLYRFWNTSKLFQISLNL